MSLWGAPGIDGFVGRLEEKRSRAEGAEVAETEVVDFGVRRSGLEGEFWVKSAEGEDIEGLSGRRSEGSGSKHKVL